MKGKKDSILEVKKLLEKAYKMRGENMLHSISLTEKALKKSKDINNYSLIAQSLSRLALFYTVISEDNQKAIEMSEEAIKYFRKDNNELGIAEAQYNMGGAYFKTNNYHLGMFHYIDCLTIFRKHGDKHNESKTHKALGAVYEALGDQLNAIKAYKSASECAIEIDNKNLESNAYNPLSGIYIKTGAIKKAHEIIEKAIAIKLETNDRRGYAFSIYGRGKVYLALEKYDEALKYFEEALTIHEEVGDLFGICICHLKMAKLYKNIGNVELAKKCLNIVLELSTKHNLSMMKYKSCHFLYLIYKEEKNTDLALKFFEKHIHERDSAVNSQILKVIKNYERISILQSKENEVKLERQKAEIAAKQEQAEQTAALKQNFLSAMSHEIRTPLNAVTSIISLLKERSDEEEEKLLTSLRFSAKNLMRIINDILDFSKLDSDKMNLEMHPSKFKEVLYNIHQTYLSLAEEKGISLNLIMADSVADTYEIDETKLFQIIGNLVSNAIKYTEKGTVDITIKAVEIHEKRDVLSFEVRDTGIGIPTKEQERLFEIFYMPKSIMTRNDGGTGLGLAIVKKLVELHGSTIQLDSKVGIGSVFSFDLMFNKVAMPVQMDQKVFTALKNKTALLAEDNEINSLVMRKLLKKWGISIIRVKNGKQAIEKAKEVKVDFILMDIHMPDMNGYDATHTIRNTENLNQHVPIFALTADVTSANEREFSHLFDGFLWKPIEIARLYETLSNVYIGKNNNH